MNVKHAAEAVALAVYERHPTDNVAISMVREVIDELAGHRDDCGCGRCGGARTVRAEQVLWQVRVWQANLAATHRRARR